MQALVRVCVVSGDWLSPQEAADLLGVELQTAYAYASGYDWEVKRLGTNRRHGVLYWADDVREELPNHGRALSAWDA